MGPHVRNLSLGFRPRKTQTITKVLIRVSGWAGWSVLLLFANSGYRFSCVESHIAWHDIIIIIKYREGIFIWFYACFACIWQCIYVQFQPEQLREVTNSVSARTLTLSVLLARCMTCFLHGIWFCFLCSEVYIGS